MIFEHFAMARQGNAAGSPAVEAVQPKDIENG